MAARNPTDFTRWPELRRMAGGKVIRATPIDAIYNDQEYILDCRNLIVSVGGMLEAHGGSTTIQTLKVRSKDMCDVDGVSNDEISHDFCVLARMSGAGNRDITLTSSLATASGTATINVNSTTLQWWGFDQLNIKSNDNVDTLTLATGAAGSGSVFLYAWGVYARET